jgi:hypothetical protein
MPVALLVAVAGALDAAPVDDDNDEFVGVALRPKFGVSTPAVVPPLTPAPR